VRNGPSWEQKKNRSVSKGHTLGLGRYETLEESMEKAPLRANRITSKHRGGVSHKELAKNGAKQLKAGGGCWKTAASGEGTRKGKKREREARKGSGNGRAEGAAKLMLD